MKVFSVIVFLILGALIGAASVIGYQSRGAVEGADSGGREILYYRNPMDPSITSDTPRKDHMGMDYIPVYADAEGDEAPGVVRISPMVMQNMNVKVAMVERGDLPREVHSVGFVDYDEREVANVHLRTDGWIEDLRMRETGRRVVRGEVLFRLYSPTLINAQEEFLQVARRGGPLDTARERLRALGMEAETILELERRGEPLRLVPVKARRGGVIKALNVAEGMYVTPGTVIMSIADLDRVWVLMDLFEHQASMVSEGDAAEVALSFRPGEVLHGTVDFVYPTLATPTRTVRVRLAFPNPEGHLKPGMYADVRLDVEPLRGVVHVPAQAVIRTGDRDRVIVALGEGRFEGRQVRLGRRAGGHFEILDGLSVDERIVSSGHFLIDSESAVGADLDRMRETDAPETQEHEIRAAGVVRVVDASGRLINLTHEPIAQLNWPAMTMDFAVAPEVDLTTVEPGMEVRFHMIEHGESGYLITLIEPAGETRHD